MSRRDHSHAQNMKTPLLALALGAAILAPAAARADDADPNLLDSTHWLQRHRIDLEWGEVGPVVKKGKLDFTSQIRMHPAGFKADTYDLLVAPVYGFANGWEATAGVSMAQRLGPGGTAFFFGGGLQKEILRGEDWRPSVSLGGYGMFGPHDYQGGSVYLAATEKLYSDKRGFGAYLHGGAKYELFSSDDYGDHSGVRPYTGLSLSYKRKYSLAAEWAPRQSFEQRDPWAVRAAVRVYKQFEISGGIRSSGYRTHPFIGFGF